MSRRAEVKELRRTVKVGDVVTWGSGATSHRVVEARLDGVVVDVTSCHDAASWSRRQPDGRYFLFVPFHSSRGVERVRLSSDAPDGCKGGPT